jgi:hypothetical protein
MSLASSLTVAGRMAEGLAFWFVMGEVSVGLSCPSILLKRAGIVPRSNADGYVGKVRDWPK